MSAQRGANRQTTKDPGSEIPSGGSSCRSSAADDDCSSSGATVAVVRFLAATVATFSLLGLATAVAQAAPTRTAKLTPAEEKWVKPVVNVFNVVNAGLGVVGKQTTADGALVPGTKANKTLIVTLGVFVDCGAAIKRAKAPPTTRLKPVASSMTNACAFLKKGALGVANGVSTIYKRNNAKLASLQIQAAFKDFAKGTQQLASAQRRLLTLGGKNVFSG